MKEIEEEDGEIGGGYGREGKWGRGGWHQSWGGRGWPTNIEVDRQPGGEGRGRLGERGERKSSRES